MNPSIHITVFLRKAFKIIMRAILAKQTLDHLRVLRQAELTKAMELMPPPPARLLEIGAGTGWQALVLLEMGYEVCAVDLPSSRYATERVFAIQEYDGQKLPFSAGEFDIVFSSNVLEHIKDRLEFQAEIQRVLKAGGQAVHVLPSSTWRFWTNVTHLMKFGNNPRVHGEHSANAWDEINQFSRNKWRKIFTESCWQITAEQKNNLFYTGNSVMDSRLSLGARRFLSTVFGNSCNIFVLNKIDKVQN
jgi:ubiquinone/menaquinone biosynthesis C-methylase UbiE